MEEKNEEEKIIDVKSTLESFIEEELPELTQEEAIKNYKKEDVIEYYKKKKKSSEEENEDDEHLKRVKRELLESLKRVEQIEKKIFDEKGGLKNVKVKKSGSGKSSGKEQIMEQKKEKLQDVGENIENKGRSRE